jgi:hypothetical protein
MELRINHEGLEEHEEHEDKFKIFVLFVSLHSTNKVSVPVRILSLSSRPENGS